MKNSENADRPISAMEYSPSRRGATRLSGSPAQTSNQLLDQNHLGVETQLAPVPEPPLPLAQAFFRHLWHAGLTPLQQHEPTLHSGLARLLQMRLVRIENRCQRTA